MKISIHIILFLLSVSSAFSQAARIVTVPGKGLTGNDSLWVEQAISDSLAEINNLTPNQFLFGGIDGRVDQNSFFQQNTTASYLVGRYSLVGSTTNFTSSLSMDNLNNNTLGSIFTMNKQTGFGGEMQFFTEGTQQRTWNIIQRVFNGDPNQSGQISQAANLSFFVTRGNGTKAAPTFVTGTGSRLLNRPSFLFANGNTSNSEIIFLGTGTTSGNGGLNIAVPSLINTRDSSIVDPPINFLYSTGTGVLKPASINYLQNAGTSGALAGGAVLVLNSRVKATSIIVVSYNTIAGTPGILSVPTAGIVPGVAFTILSSSGTDTSTVNWHIAKY